MILLFGGLLMMGIMLIIGGFLQFVLAPLLFPEPEQQNAREHQAGGWSVVFLIVLMGSIIVAYLAG